ncbi:hypothetical protein AAF712_013814 [Marasmius tenuissimus]|uniref:EthD domain-containing protein n=1 Tax=Marasmius tenuissimus TaxID=585030 RepID=A0ABR2ZEM0_9AGAR
MSSSTKAFLIVFSTPGDQVTQDEFQDWYNNEHVPLRLDNLDFFLSGARFRDPNPPQAPLTTDWAAVYEITSAQVFQEPSYTGLREKRSAREASVVKRLGVLDRRTFEVASVIEREEGGEWTGLNVGNPTQGIVTHKSTTENVDVGKNVEGWRRTWILEGLDSGVTVEGKQVETAKDSGVFVVHEFTSYDAACDFAGTLQPQEQYTEVRSWELYRAYPCIARP